ncbi:unnamed protein product [Toxocara canis]|uniref:Transposase n=1 Tax=Toxocara canis TaxID=6265 RepID=A0A183V897_TOXCA|nr:unnamed protein product [Toxocara canis]
MSSACKHFLHGEVPAICAYPRDTHITKADDSLGVPGINPRRTAAAAKRSGRAAAFSGSRREKERKNRQSGPQRPPVGASVARIGRALVAGRGFAVRSDATPHSVFVRNHCALRAFIDEATEKLRHNAAVGRSVRLLLNVYKVKRSIDDAT